MSSASSAYPLRCCTGPYAGTGYPCIFLQTQIISAVVFPGYGHIWVLPHYDCNHPPYCIWTDEEKGWLEAYVARYPGSRGSLISHDSKCVPAVDILPNLQAVRCFGMSDFIKVPIADFRNAADLNSFFLNEIDSNACRISSCSECRDCYDRKTMHCYAGCIGFKASGIKACNTVVECI